MHCTYHPLGNCPYGNWCRLAPGNLLPTTSYPTYTPTFNQYAYKGSSFTTYESSRERTVTTIDTARIIGFVASIAAIIAGFVAPYFVHPLIGTALFFGGIAGFIGVSCSG
jgi:hypothetical protein